MSAEVYRRGPGDFFAWCPECADGTDGNKDKTHMWADDHNHAEHPPHEAGPKAEAPHDQVAAPAEPMLGDEAALPTDANSRADEQTPTDGGQGPENGAQALRVFERTRHGYMVPTLLLTGRTVDVLHTFHSADKRAQRKRFSDAESAAEYWAEAAIPSLPFYVELTERRLTLRRFAALPHAIEGDYL